MSKRSVTIVAIILGLVVAALVVSRLTTAITWYGATPEDEWSIYVQDNHGAALPHACLAVVSAEGQPLSYRGDESGLFENYSTPESVCADDNGVLRLRTRSLPYGGSHWKLFWIWSIGSSPQDDISWSFFLEISAPSYKTAAVSVNDLMSQEEITVRLKARE